MCEFGYVVRLVMFWGAVPTQQPPSQQQQSSSCPADVQSRSQLVPLGLNQQWVVEVGDDGVGRPGDWNKTQHS